MSGFRLKKEERKDEGRVWLVLGLAKMGADEMEEGSGKVYEGVWGDEKV